MMRSDKHWLEVVEAFANAAFAENGWERALEMLATATGSRCGQLIGLGGEGAVPFNFWTNFDPARIEEFTALGHGNPEINPRVRAGISVPELTLVTEADFLTREEFRTNEAVQWGHRNEASYSCLTPLVRNHEMLVGLAVIRSGKQGHINEREKTVFRSLAPHVRAAVRTRILLEEQAAMLLTGALEAMSLSAFACDRQGRVVRMTSGAERVLSGGRHLRLKQQSLAARVPEDDIVLAAAIRAAAAGPGETKKPILRSLFLRSREQPLSPLVADVISLPSKAFFLAQAPAVLVVIRTTERAESHLASALQSVFFLTAAEAQVTLLLAGSKTPATIAAHRGVSLGTVRTQIKSVYAKLSVSRHAELMARLRPLM